MALPNAGLNDSTSLMFSPALFRQRRIIFPQPFQCCEQSLLLHAVVRVAGVAGEDELFFAASTFAMFSFATT